MIDREVEEIFIRRKSLDELGADVNALAAVDWDRIETSQLADGRTQKIGVDDRTGESRVLQVSEAEAGSGPTVSQVVEDGVSYDVETRPDGSQWLLGRTGTRSGVGVMLAPPPVVEAKEPGMGTSGQPAGAEVPSLTEGFVDELTGMVQGVVPGALLEAQPAPEDLQLLYADESAPEEARRQAVMQAGQERGLDIAFRRVPGVVPIRFEPVIKTPEMEPPGGVIGKAADFVGRLLGLGMAEPAIGAGVKAVQAAKAFKSGKAGDAATVSAGGIIDKLIKPFIGPAGRRAVHEGLLERPVAPLVPRGATIAEEMVITKVVPVGRINTSQEAMDAFNAVAKAKEAEIETARRGKVLLKETEAAGRKLERDVLDQMGVDDRDSVKEFMMALASDVKNLDARIQASREFLTASMEETATRAKVIAKPIQDVTDTDVFRYLEQETRHTELQILFTGARAEIGRSLGAFRNVAQAAPGSGAALEDLMRQSQIMLEAIDAAGGKQGIINRAKYLLATPPDRRGLFIKKATETQARTSDVLFEIYINGLLSGGKTQERNLFGNLLFFGWQVPERIGAGAIGKVRQVLPGADPVRVYMMEGAALIHGFIESIPSALRLGWQTFKTEIPSSQLAKTESGGFRNITAKKFGLDEQSLPGRFVDLVGSTIRLPGRFMIAADEINKAAGSQAEARALAYRYAQQAMDDGKTAQEAAEVYADVILGKNATANLEKQSFADMTTFTSRLGEAGQAIQEARTKIPGARLIATFVRTPGNILKETVKRTLFAPVLKEVREDLVAGGARRDLALARISMGTAATAWAVHLASQDIITGGGPSDPRLRRVWLEKYAPYSIDLERLIGKKAFEDLGLSGQWLPYGNIAPLSTLFGIAANIADYLKWAPADVAQEDEDGLAMRAVGSTLKTVGDQTWLRGLADMAAAYHDPERYGEGFVSRILTNFIPFSSLSRELKNAIDPVYRSTKISDPNDNNPVTVIFQRFLNEVKARTPGFSEDLPPRLSFWGEEIKAYDGSWVDAFNIFALRKKKAQPIDDELLNLRYPIAGPRPEIDGVKLTPWQHHNLVKALNGIEVENPSNGKKQDFRGYLNWLIGTDGYRMILSDEKKIDIIRDARNKFVDAARNQMVSPGTKWFDADLFSAVTAARIRKPLGLPALP